MYIRVIKDTHGRGRTSVKMPGGVTSDFLVGMGLHQGPALSHLLFTLVMDEFTGEIQDELHSVFYSHMTLFLLMRPGRGLMTSWSDGDIHRSLKVLE